MPLYITVFLQGFVFWYGIEKFFMESIGFTEATIGLSIAVVAVVTIVTETPSGILADRWSRKGVLALASIALIACTLLSGLSNSVLTYTIAVSLWGLYAALYSGTFDSIVYDTLLEEAGDSKLYEKYYGYVRIIEGVALASGSLLSMVIIRTLTIRATYFLTIPFLLLSVFFIMRFREPQLHKREVYVPIFRHVGEIFKALTRKGEVFWIVFTMVLLGLGVRTTFEFGQLWYIAVGVPVIFFGIASALVQLSTSFSGIVARLLTKPRIVTVYLIVLILTSLFLTGRNALLIIFTQVMLLTGFMAVTIVLEHQLHKTLASTIRAGASSAVGTIYSIVFVALSLGFGVVAEKFTIFKASWFLTTLLVLALIGMLKITSHKKKLVVETVDIQKISEHNR